jgi:DNA-binding Lrp family transcriptional regulator
LIRNARKSDREIAKALGISQPTVTRKRASLDKEGYIREYTIIPDLGKMGYEIMAISFLAFSEARPELSEKAREWCRKQPSVIYAAGGEGLGMHSVMVSLHKNYAGFSQLITNLREDWQPNLKDVQSFLMSIGRKELVYKELSFKSLEESQE